MLISHTDHNNTIQVYSVTVMTHVIALEDGQSSQGHLSLLQLCVTYVEWVPHLGQDMLTLSGTPDFTPFIYIIYFVLHIHTRYTFIGEFMISPIHYIYIIYYWICNFSDYVYGWMTGLFVWISLTALSRTYFIYKRLDPLWVYHTIPCTHRDQQYKLCIA